VYMCVYACMCVRSCECVCISVSFKELGKTWFCVTPQSWILRNCVMSFLSLSSLQGGLGPPSIWCYVSCCRL